MYSPRLVNMLRFCLLRVNTGFYIIGVLLLEFLLIYEKSKNNYSNSMCNINMY